LQNQNGKFDNTAGPDAVAGCSKQREIDDCSKKCRLELSSVLDKKLQRDAESNRTVQGPIANSVESTTITLEVSALPIFGFIEFKRSQLCVLCQ
jgi:hypothetical protein